MEYILAHREPETPELSLHRAGGIYCNGALRTHNEIQMTITTIGQGTYNGPFTNVRGLRYRDIDFVSTSPSDTNGQGMLRGFEDAIQMTSSDSTATSSANTLTRRQWNQQGYH
jgi:hypothetical protein